MIISEESYLRLPPRKLNAEQTTIFNAITYSVDICDVCYNRLYEKLIGMTTNPKANALFYGEVFSDAWSIINSSTIFFNLITRYFKKTKNGNLVEIRKAKKLRNSHQHIDERIGEVYASKNSPIYGSLAWRHNILDSDECILSILSAGVFTHHDRFEASLTPGESTGEEVENITLRAIVKEKNQFIEIGVCLNRLMKELQDYILKIEKSFAQQIEALENSKVVERHGSNMLLMFKGIRVISE